jgi:DnaJ-class molecular chaperone
VWCDCPTCDGTGEVHSHNPKCWDCDGKKVVIESIANKLKEENRKRNPTWHYLDEIK